MVDNRRARGPVGRVRSLTGSSISDGDSGSGDGSCDTIKASALPHPMVSTLGLIAQSRGSSSDDALVSQRSSMSSNDWISASRRHSLSVSAQNGISQGGLQRNNVLSGSSHYNSRSFNQRTFPLQRTSLLGRHIALPLHSRISSGPMSTPQCSNPCTGRISNLPRCDVLFMETHLTQHHCNSTEGMWFPLRNNCSLKDDDEASKYRRISIAGTIDSDTSEEDGDADSILSITKKAEHYARIEKDTNIVVPETGKPVRYMTDLEYCQQ
jgi:hypothetical protein